MSNPLPLFVQTMCASRSFCVTCRRNDPRAAEHRAEVAKGFRMPAGWPACPIGLRMGATAEDVSRAWARKTARVGTALKRRLEGWGIKSASCGCNALAARMDVAGVDACRTNPLRAEVLDHLEAEAERRELPYGRFAGEQLLEQSIADALAEAGIEGGS